MNVRNRTGQVHPAVIVAGVVVGVGLLGGLVYVGVKNHQENVRIAKEAYPAKLKGFTEELSQVDGSVLVQGERKLLEGRRAQLDSRTNAINEQIAQVGKDIARADAKIDMIDDSLAKGDPSITASTPAKNDSKLTPEERARQAEEKQKAAEERASQFERKDQLAKEIRSLEKRREELKNDLNAAIAATEKLDQRIASLARVSPEGYKNAVRRYFEGRQREVAQGQFPSLSVMTSKVEWPAADWNWQEPLIVE